MFVSFHFSAYFSSIFFVSFHLSIYFSSLFSISFHYSTYFSSVFSISFHYSTYLSSIFSKSFHYFLPYFQYHFTIYFRIFNVFSLFNWGFFRIFMSHRSAVTFDTVCLIIVVSSFISPFFYTYLVVFCF